ncbi:MAG: RDD family protein [Solirubrobacterales bacterium]|nr:RDD family protein [Solirubrobacterales bacterium]
MDERPISDTESAERPPSGPAAARANGSGSIGGRLIGSGARGARRVAGVTGIDRTVETAVEEAIVRAFESAPVERAVGRILDGPATQQAVERALESPAVAQAVERALDGEAVEGAVRRALDSELVDRIWEQLLASDEVQKLIERIAEAPEVRSALSSQGVGLIEDMARRLRSVAGRLDHALERIARTVLRRPRREERVQRAGLVTRALALGVDALILQGIFLLSASIFGYLRTNIFGIDGPIGAPSVAFGAVASALGVLSYFLTFWSLAGQTPGMRFLGLRIEHDEDPYLGLGRSVRRLVGVVLSLLPLGAGFLMILFSERRQGFHDRFAGTEVDYVEPDITFDLLPSARQRESEERFHDDGWRRRAGAKRAGTASEEVAAAAAGGGEQLDERTSAGAEPTADDSSSPAEPTPTEVSSPAERDESRDKEPKIPGERFFGGSGSR